jgi:hypothetical protein
VHGVLFRRPDSLELLDEIGARDNADARERAHEFNRARVHARDVGDVVHRRILHGDVAQQKTLVVDAA